MKKRLTMRVALVSVVAMMVVVASACTGGGGGGGGGGSRKALLGSIATDYFAGLEAHNLDTYPFAAGIVLRAPLAPPCVGSTNGGAECPITGEANVRAYFDAVLPLIGDVTVRDVYFNDALTIVCAEATVGVVTPVFSTSVRVADCFTVDEAGEVIEQENHFDPRNITHPGAYRAKMRDYFTALATGTVADLNALYADTVRVRAPLYVNTANTAQYGAEYEIVGKTGVVNYLSPFLPGIDSAAVKWIGIDGNRGCVEADVGLPSSAATPRVRVVDCFDIDPATGLVTAQENHFDPRPALPPCSICGGTATANCFCPP